MNLKKTVIVFAFLALVVSGEAMGKQIPLGGAYISLQLGYGGIDGKSYDGLTQDNMGLAYRLSGGYLFNITDNFKIGPELGYFGYPKDKYTYPTVTFELKGYSLELLENARYYFNNRWYGFAKAGFAYVQQKLTASHPANLFKSISYTKSKLLPELGFGLGYQIKQNVSLDASYHRVFGDANVLQYGINLSPDMSNAEIGPISAWLIGFNCNF